MGTILASSIVNKASTLLYDINGEKWNQSELLGWLNDGQRQIVSMQPDANRAPGVMQMVAGTKQVIPSDGWSLIEVQRNMGTDGQTPGRAVRLVPRKLLDQFSPNWHFATQQTTVKEWVFETQDPRSFWVNPPSDGTGYLQVLYSQVPTDLTMSTVITLNDIFEPMLLDYILYRAYSKRSPDADFGKATAYWGSFAAKVAGKVSSERAIDPTADITHRPPTDTGGE